MSALVAAAVIPYATVDKGFSSGIRQQKFAVVKTNNEWRELWREHTAIVVPPKELPRVDFGTEMVVAVFLGEQRRGGVAVEITKIEESSEKREIDVFWRETRPATGSMTFQMLTQPFHIVKLQKSESAVVFASEKGR